MDRRQTPRSLAAARYVSIPSDFYMTLEPVLRRLSAQSAK